MQGLQLRRTIWKVPEHVHASSWQLRPPSGMGSTAWCRIAKLAECLVRTTDVDDRLGVILLRWQSRRKSASMCVSLVTISWNVGLHTWQGTLSAWCLACHALSQPACWCLRQAARRAQALQWWQCMRHGRPGRR